MTPTHQEAICNTLFVWAWQALAKQAKCDDWGSAQQERILSEWKAAGYPLPITNFIEWRANISAEVRS